MCQSKKFVYKMNTTNFDIWNPIVLVNNLLYKIDQYKNTTKFYFS
jgi:hypothetical protein